MKDNFSHILKNKGFKITQSRLDILNIFSSGCKPINAEYIFNLLKKKNINLVTIYRTLFSFEKAGIIKRVDLHQESIYYELAGDHHHHIICLNCKKIVKFDGCQKDSDSLIAKALKTTKDFAFISHHSFDLFGLCKKCSKNIL
jgi:Fur family ferric uptake transcriptional regulator